MSKLWIVLVLVCIIFSGCEYEFDLGGDSYLVKVVKMEEEEKFDDARMEMVRAWMRRDQKEMLKQAVFHQIDQIIDEFDPVATYEPNVWKVWASTYIDDMFDNHDINRYIDRYIICPPWPPFDPDDFSFME